MGILKFSTLFVGSEIGVGGGGGWVKIFLRNFNLPNVECSSVVGSCWWIKKAIGQGKGELEGVAAKFTPFNNIKPIILSNIKLEPQSHPKSVDGKIGEAKYFSRGGLKFYNSSRKAWIGFFLLKVR